VTEELEIVIKIVRDASKIILKHFSEEFEVEYKRDKFDPVTKADREADNYIRQALAKAFPGDEILSEENDYRPAALKERVWLVDPIDGTKEFVARGDSFSTIVGLLEGGQPKLGVVFVPARNHLYYAVLGKGAFKVSDGKTIPIKVSTTSDINKATLLTRHIHNNEFRPLEEWTNKIGFGKRKADGSIGTKMCLVAEGKGEAFIHTTSCNKWDTLGGEVILREAGGITTDIDGKPLNYLQPQVDWPRFVVASNNRSINEQIIPLLTDFQ
jgi:3'(2'), 5'-bisphosphate nucleotidase